MRDFLLHNWPWFLVAAIVGYFGFHYWRDRRLQAGEPRAAPAPLPDELVLQRMVNQLTRRQLHMLDALVICTLLGLLGFTYLIVAGAHPDKEAQELLAMLLAKLRENPRKLVNMLFFTSMALLIPRIVTAINRNERLVLDRSGIRYYSPFTGIFAKLNPGWSLSWSEIESVSLRNQFVRGGLYFKPFRGKKRIVIAHLWRRPEELRTLWQLPLVTRIREIRRQQTDLIAMLELPLPRYLREVAGITIDSNPAGELEFDLSSNPITRMTVIALFALMGYGIMDVLANSETYVIVPPVFWFVLGGVLITILLGSWLRRRNVSTTNAWGLSGLFGVIFALAMYPALLRINQLTDTAGIQQVTYRHGVGSHFRPQAEQFPEIRFRPDVYWRSIPLDALVTFHLRRGGLGFYQIDMAPEYAKMRRWNCARRAKNDQIKLQWCNKI